MMTTGTDILVIESCVGAIPQGYTVDVIIKDWDIVASHADYHRWVSDPVDYTPVGLHLVALTLTDMSVVCKFLFDKVDRKRWGTKQIR